MFDRLDALPAAADRLLAGAGLFGSLVWWRTVLEYGMPRDTTPCFVLACAGDTPIALLPLRKRHKSSGLDGLATPYTCLYVPLLAPGLDAAMLAAVFTTFGRFCRGWATTRLDALPEEWPALPACMAGAQAAGLVAVPFAHFGNWYEDVRGVSWDAYVARRPGALRETIRRKLRRAEQRSDAGFRVVRGGTALEAGIAAYDYVYARSWKQPEPFPHFNAALMRGLAALGMLRLGLWEAGGVPVAAQFWSVEHGTATVLKLAHDTAMQAESPGTVLTALMLRTLIESERIAEINFGRGDDPYKQAWAGQRRQRIGLVLANPRRAAGLAFLARHAAGRIRSSAAAGVAMLRGARRG